LLPVEIFRALSLSHFFLTSNWCSFSQSYAIFHLHGTGNPRLMLAFNTHLLN
jgi:hypothetical protein